MNEGYILRGESRGNVDEILTKIRYDLKRFKKRDELKVQTGEKTTFTSTIDSTNILREYSRRDFKYDYNTLLKGKVKDPEIKREVVRYAEVIVKPSITNKVTLKVTKGVHPVLKVFSTIPDHKYIIAMWWIGKKLDRSELFPLLVKQFAHEMSTKHNINSVKVEVLPSDTCTVTSTIQEMTHY